VVSTLGKLSNGAGALRWLFMPLGLFALVAVGLHTGAAAFGDWLLAAFDTLDGLTDRALASYLLWTGSLFGVDPARVDGWVFSAPSFVDLRERALMARWCAVGLELLADLTLAGPLLAYREKADEDPALTQRVEAIRAARGLGPKAPERLLPVIREAFRDPTLLRLLLPLTMAAATLAGPCRVATEVQVVPFSATSSWVDAEAAGVAARIAALTILAGIFWSLGGRAVGQALWWAHGKADSDQRSGQPRMARRLRGAVRLAIVSPVALAAVLHGAPLWAFFR